MVDDDFDLVEMCSIINESVEVEKCPTFNFNAHLENLMNKFKCIKSGFCVSIYLISYSSFFKVIYKNRQS